MISEKEMGELRPLVIATFDNCNTPKASTKLDVLECIINVFRSFKSN